MIAEPGLPPWVGRLVAAINREFLTRDHPQSPVRLPEFAAAADLPPPADWRSALVFVKAINMAAVSDGTNWRRLDTGATL